MDAAATRRLAAAHWRGLLVAAVLGIHGTMLAWGVICTSPTPDEPNHLVGGIRQWQCGRHDVNRGNPPLLGLVAAVPVLAAQPQTNWSHVGDQDSFRVGVDFIGENRPRLTRLIILGRWACIPFALVGGYFCYRWSRDLYGYAAGLVALTLWCFSPFILGNGPLITGDTAATALGVTAFYAFWKWLSDPSWQRAVLAGLALGAAELTKYVWVILYLLWPLLWLLWGLLSRREGRHRPWWRELLQAGLLGLVCLYVIHLGYFFEEPIKPLSHYRIGRAIVQQVERITGSAAWLANFPIPLPESYIAGVDEISTVHHVGGWSYLRGEWRRGGWWYYYPYALSLKLPLGVLALLVLAGAMSLWKDARAEWRSDLPLVLSIIAILVFISAPETNQVIRYAMPLLPLMYVLASKCGTAIAANRGRTSLVALACLVWSVASCLWVYPHNISYFNEIVGGPKGGSFHLLGPDIDWGQDLFYLKQWYDRHPEARPFHVSYASPFDPTSAGIEFSRAPCYDPDRRNQIPASEQGPLPGWYAVSLNCVRGVLWGTVDRGEFEFRYFQHFRPVAMAGYSIYIYHITLREANRVRRGLGLPELSEGSLYSAKANHE